MKQNEPRRPRPRKQRVDQKTRDPQATREALIEAARDVLSQDGAEGLHVTAVARRAGVTRATAYLHFQNRAQLMEAATAWISDQLYAAVFDYPAFAPGQPMEAVTPREMIQHLAGFAMENAELCGVWLQEVLSSDEPAADRFWGRYMEVMKRFVNSDLAQEGIDVEVHTVVMLAGTFLWPVWSNGQAHSARMRRKMAERFADEMLRLLVHGTMRPARFAHLAAR